MRNSDLTKRELEVARLVGEGKMNKEIADECKVTLRTIERRRQLIIQKLNVPNMYRAIRDLTRQRLI